MQKLKVNNIGVTMKLSEHFELSELTYSDTAKRFGIKNEPTPIHLKTLKHTCEYFLEKLRYLCNQTYTKWNGKKVIKVYIKITSGYRSKELNAALKKAGYKPATKSMHQDGQAVDFDVYCVTEDKVNYKIPYTQVYEDIKKWVREGRLSVDQLICERDGNSTWLHGSYKAAGATVNRKQFLKFDGKNYVEDKG